MPARPRLLFHVQHLLGIGHLMRAGILARALEASGFEVTLVSGGMPVPVFRPAVSRFEQLPPMRAADPSFRQLVDAAGAPIDERFRIERRRRLLALEIRLRPDVVLTELYPLGRWQMRFELEPLLEQVHARRWGRSHPMVASSVRDILVAPDDAERIDAMLVRARRWFDLVLVHGDPAFVALDESFPRIRELADLVHYTGYVSESPPAREGPGAPGHDEVIVSTGGGAVSHDLLAAAIAARPLTPLAAAPWRVLVGHNLADGELGVLQREAGPGITLERARPDFLRLLANCRLSISQAGYNTVMDLLATGARAVCVPFRCGRETEQTLRCRQLAGRGLVEVVDPDDLSASALATAIGRALDRQIPSGPLPDTEGALTSARLLRATLGLDL